MEIEDAVEELTNILLHIDTPPSTSPLAFERLGFGDLYKARILLRCTKGAKSKEKMEERVLDTFQRFPAVFEWIKAHLQTEHGSEHGKERLKYTLWIARPREPS